MATPTASRCVRARLATCVWTSVALACAPVAVTPALEVKTAVAAEPAAAEPAAAEPTAAVEPVPKPATASCGDSNAARPPSFQWPVPGAVTSAFGMRRGERHEGIDISSRSGMVVRAAAAGTVVFSDRKPGYGRVIFLKHAGGYETVYAHNQDNLVLEGARVAQGQVIADMGRTGEASGPHLHFEVRIGDRPVDPLACLPARSRGR